MILVAGPYRSGTHDEPAKREANVTAMQGADEMVRTAQAQGKQVFYRLEDVPGCAAP
jgi:hypothetical protein